MVTPRYLLDTNVAIDLLRGLPKLDQAKFIAAEGVIAISTITVMELEFGIERSSRPDTNRAEVVALLSRLVVLPFSQLAAEHAGRIRAHLADRGLTIGPFDALLAGHARSAALTLVTHNTREFSRVPGLLLEDWTRS
ncbi:MAG: type II toxin-antitoxin system VapC family toxin [Micrococcales bacterium]|nr:type II toxin-antitoxin system VapC family toxin [Micrococcales bacterium]